MSLRVAGAGGRLDGRVRRFLDDIGEPWRPAVYHAERETGSGDIDGASVRIYPDDGPLVVTSLGTACSPIDETDRDGHEFWVSVNGQKRLDGVGWHDCADDVDSWPRPVVVLRGEALEVRSRLALDGGGIAVGGLHTTQVAAMALREAGELWGARIAPRATSNEPDALAELRLDLPTFVSEYVNAKPDLDASDVGNVYLRVGAVELTPQFVPLAPLLPSRPGDVGGRVGVFCAAGELIRAQFQYPGSGQLELSFYGWRRYG